MYRRNCDGLVCHTHLCDDFGDEFVHNSVAAARAVVHRYVIEQFRFAVNDVLRLHYFFFCHSATGLEGHFLDFFYNFLRLRDDTAKTAVPLNGNLALYCQADVFYHLAGVNLKREDALDLLAQLCDTL